MKPSIPRWAIGILGAAAAFTNASAASQHSLTQSITIASDPAKVWALVGNFEEIAQWNPAVERSLAVDENNGAPARLVIFKGDAGKEMDVLDARDDAHMTLRYHMASSSWPITHYQAELRVSPGAAPGTSVVTWHGMFDTPVEAPDPDSPPPPEGMPPRGPMVYGFDVETNPGVNATPVHQATRTLKAEKILSNQYQSGLEGLKWVLER